MSLRHIVALSMFAVSTPLLADSFDINLRDNSAQFQYNAALGHATLGKSELHLGYLYTSKANNSLVDFGILVKDQVSPDAPGLMVGFGVKGLIARANTYNASALALGGLVRYSPPSVPRLGLVGTVDWSPNILTFGDADRSIQTGMRVEYEVIPQAAAYIGYRKIKFGIKNATDTTLESGVHVGVRMSF